MIEPSVDDISIIEIWHGQIVLLSKDRVANIFYTPKEADMVLKHLSPCGDKMDTYTKALFCAIEKGIEMLEGHAILKAESND